MSFESRIGPYELREELGRGASAIVWRAFDTRLEREVALKVLDVSSMQDTALQQIFINRFLKEARAVAKLSHRNIVAIHSVEVIDGNPVIDMELIRGTTLQGALAAAPIAPMTTLDILGQLLDGVSYTHTRGIIHRDIKPENIFLTPDGQVKLTDFGIASDTDESTGDDGDTQAGTVAYMSPEQISGGKIDFKSDLFSVGVVAYQMLTGVHPFADGENESTTSVMYKIGNEPAPALPDWVSAGLTTDIRPAIMAALSKNPEMRPASAVDLKGMLLGSAPAAAQPYTTVPPVTLSAPRQQGFPSISPVGVPQISPSKTPMKINPYIIVGAVGIVAVLIIFLIAGNGSNASKAMSASTQTQTTTAESAGITLPGSSSEPANGKQMSASDSAAFLNDTLDEIDAYGNIDTGKITAFVQKYNKAYGFNMPDSYATKSGQMRKNLIDMKTKLAQANIDPSYRGVVTAQEKLLAFSIIRVTVLRDAVSYAQQYGTADPSLLDGGAAKKKYKKLFDSGATNPN